MVFTVIVNNTYLPQTMVMIVKTLTIVKILKIVKILRIPTMRRKMEKRRKMKRRKKMVTAVSHNNNHVLQNILL